MELKSDYIVNGIGTLIVALFFYIFFGFTGLRTILGIIIFFLVPFYLFFNNFELDKSEKIILAFFCGITIFPSLVYFLGFVIPFRISMLAVFALICGISLLIRKFYKK